MGVKLHVGCGAVRKVGYINIDSVHPAADVRCDLLAIDYPPGSVDCIEGYMVIEHLTREHAQIFVANAWRMLVPGGMLILECPDMAKVARLILSLAEDSHGLESSPYGLRGIFGAPDTQLTLADVHKWGYTPASMRSLLEQAGFSKVTISDGASHLYPIRDLRAEATK